MIWLIRLTLWCLILWVLPADVLAGVALVLPGIAINPCCCDVCVECDENFAYGPSTDITTGSDCGWTETAGDWSVIAGGGLRISATANAIALCGTTPANKKQRIVVNPLNFTADGDKARIIINYVDSNNYWAFEVERVTAVPPQRILRIIERASGAETTKNEITQPLSVITTQEDLEVCFNTANIMLCRLTTMWVAYKWPSAPTSHSVAVGSGGTCTGDITFKSFTLSTAMDAAPCVACDKYPACDADDVAEEMQLVFAAGTITNNVCGSCASLEGTYVLELWGGIEGGGGGTIGCGWRYIMPATICTFTRVFLNTDSTNGNWEASFRAGDFPSLTMKWTFGTGQAGDCLGVSGLVSTAWGGGETRCTGTNTGLTITAL